ncbi:hypothetical protein SLNWT_6998 [Streptomyces albus]|uniref:Carrier domain-containing protein n=1 Tax=Streptomyces albus (strain ATCC 21838 / DSM 41398 / FERM P-419 / JCM 4703 / NBRC 107858) TaxID=1081613 RepID=A0A0B5EZX8_STRA4|nr:hypothetical protein SLNWT_6998 [Streptomyces albus]AOU81677.1 hypothetical protein SLNHY_6986 [Streptomyces albus]
MTSSTTTSTQTIEAEIRSCLTERFGVDSSSLESGVTFEGLELDSLALVELSDVLQESIGVTIADDDLNAEQTIGEAAALLLAKVHETEPTEQRS